MKWYQHIFGKEQGHAKYFKSIDKAKHANTEKWGTSKDTNVAYMTGKPKSGQTSIARAMTTDKINRIELDHYINDKGGTRSDKEFDAYLDKKQPGWRSIREMDQNSDEYRKAVDKLRDNVEAFGRKQYESGKRVLVEGSQIGNKKYSTDLNFYKGKPTIVLKTSKGRSIDRQLGIKRFRAWLFGGGGAYTSILGARLINSNYKSARVEAGLSKKWNNRLSDTVSANKDVLEIRRMIEEVMRGGS